MLQLSNLRAADAKRLEESQFSALPHGCTKKLPAFTVLRLSPRGQKAIVAIIATALCRCVLQPNRLGEKKNRVPSTFIGRDPGSAPYDSFR